MSLSPSVENYVLGRGVLSAAEWSGGAIGSYVDMGNAPTFEVELTLETLVEIDGSNLICQLSALTT
jgi:hypothetical protein